MAAILDFGRWGHKLLIWRIWDCFRSICHPRKPYISHPNFYSSCFGSKVIEENVKSWQPSWILRIGAINYWSDISGKASIRFLVLEIYKFASKILILAALDQKLSKNINSWPPSWILGIGAITIAFIITH